MVLTYLRGRGIISLTNDDSGNDEHSILCLVKMSTGDWEYDEINQWSQISTERGGTPLWLIYIKAH